VLIENEWLSVETVKTALEKVINNLDAVAMGKGYDYLVDLEQYVSDPVKNIFLNVS
jgi:hypothetical protein